MDPCCAAQNVSDNNESMVYNFVSILIVKNYILLYQYYVYQLDLGNQCIFVLQLKEIDGTIINLMQIPALVCIRTSIISSIVC